MDSPQIATAMLTAGGAAPHARRPVRPHVPWRARLRRAVESLSRVRARLG